ncbi:MAG: ABC transporter permease subunit [Gammaproteobacteria bacterium]|nr:ABC transporter permease subunit [Gammaproteobacteria bacterium]NIM73146.1 ABC transporter permease subunit [Gammaproteobacteria bacterium]NIN38826.1 ABC transporter permease subunit [Gammaproteobacteria bacterium]NIO24901.1 ABC transporter permease subunit [Gammaproteobacteria bacterium]NIO65503.1 ABC transporter permease subunit [Gammaproteobacteria bacterium]
MPEGSARLHIRPEYEATEIGAADHGDVARALSLYERVSNINSIRKLTILVGLVVVWELYTRIGGVSELILPPFSSTGSALVEALWSESLLRMIANSIMLLLAGYVIGIVIATVLTTLAVTSRFGSDLLGTLTAMLNPLPAIALLPMALLWFGLGPDAIVFTLLHSVVWPVALNTHTGFLGVSDTQRMVGRNYGLRGIEYVAKILIPAAFPSILTGLRIGWAYSWRTLIAAELVFGGSILDTEGTASGGLGWFIFANQMDLQIPHVFAGLFSVILVGVLVENVVFRKIEERTVARWGMQIQ